MRIERERTALLVIDMQNGFTEPEGSMAALGLPSQELRSAIPGCRALAAAARSADIPVIFTRYVFQPGHADAGIMATEIIPEIKARKALEAGSWDAEIIDDLTPEAGDLVVDKSRPSAFYGTRLEPILQSLDIRSLVLCGVTTNICVETTARDAAQRDYAVHVVGDATAEFESARKDHALNTIGFFFGHVTDVATVSAAWAR